jgi:ABC-type phosphate/phosphonate transport system substrate-binding protein
MSIAAVVVTTREGRGKLTARLVGPEKAILIAVLAAIPPDGAVADGVLKDGVVQRFREALLKMKSKKRCDTICTSEIILRICGRQ